MSVDALTWAFNKVPLRSSQKAILLAMADRADMNGKCWPSYDDICHRSGANRKTVGLAIKQFEQMGIIEKNRRFSASTMYRLVIERDFRSTEITISTENGPISSTENGTTASSTENGPISSTENGPSISTENGTLTVNEPSNEPSIIRRCNGKPPKLPFTSFYDHYGRKEKPKDAERAWKKLKPEEQAAAVERINDPRFKAWREERMNAKPNSKWGYFPLPSSWLNAGQWEDDLPTVEKKRVRYSSV